MYDLILYDTSNFQDFPMGGQLTSVRNFLKYIANCRKAYAERILLVGITTKHGEEGKVCPLWIDGVRFDFLPVLYRDTDLANVQSSLRLAYVKALLRNRKQIPRGKNVLHYLHTPEAYIAVKLTRPMAKTAVFSHGSFFNMTQGIRFFRENKLVHFCLEHFLIFLIKTADMLFALDEDTANRYRKYNKNVFCMENSIVLPETIPDRTACHEPVRLLFVGRLSRVKRIDGIIDAVEHLGGSAHLTIVGDGEEHKSLEKLIAEKNLADSVCLAGGCAPGEVSKYYRECDILVMNSVVEGKPMVILEAMSYGMPVVTTPVGGIPEMVTSGKSAEFTDGTAQIIVEKVRHIQKHYAVYAAEAVAASAHYAYDRVNAEIMEKLEKNV